MAKLKLTIHGIECYKEKSETVSARHDISISTEQEVDIFYVFSADGIEKTGYQLNLVDFSFRKKMYQPTEIIAKIHIAGLSGDQSEWKHLSKADTDSLFLNRKVSLEEEVAKGANPVIGSDFYVQEVEADYLPDAMYVILKIYSPDHLMTLEKGCCAFVAQKLGAQILAEQTKKYKLPWEPLELDEKNNDKRHCLPYSYENMRVLKYTRGDGTVSEHIFPYLVQYNESFYDMLKRTANRWGEFLYYEDGKLQVGFDASQEAQELTGWQGLKYCQVAKSLMTGENTGTYDPEAAYDTNIIDSQLQKSPDVIKNLASCSLENGLDVWLMKKIESFLGNTDSIPTWLGSQAADEAWETATAYKNKDTVDSDFNSKYFDEVKVPEQWGMAKFDGETKDGHNPFTELNTTYNSDKYRNVLCKEQYAGRNAVQLDYDTTYPDLKLGQIVKVYSQEYIVTEVTAKVVRKTGYKLVGDMKVDKEKSTVELPTVEQVTTSELMFQVTATARNGVKDDTGELDGDGNPILALTDLNFYPAMLPSGHIRVAEPQLARVFDSDDPLNQNRVRIFFSWQNVPEDIDEKEGAALASPWLVYATSAASEANGIFGKHYPGDAVIVNFSNGNVENPYVVGGLAMKGNKVPGSLAERDIVLSSPGGHTLRMDDGGGAGLTAFLTGTFMPVYEQLTTFVPITSGKDIFSEEVTGDALGADQKIIKRFEGGFELTDKYGIYLVKGSTDGREVSIKSPWGDVKINAFTGISISAPNGDIEIKGKNVTIEAGNNLELKSGTNVDYKLAEKKETNLGTAGQFVKDMAAPVLDLLDEKFQIFDLSFIRNVVEVVMRPVEGALTVKSSRFLKLEAGEGECDYPVSAYKDEETVNKLRKDEEEENLRPGLQLLPGVKELIGKVSHVADSIDADYRTLFNKCVKLLRNQSNSLKKAIIDGQTWVKGDDRNAAYCKSYDELKEKLWADGEGLLTEDDLGFKDNYALEGNSAVDNPSRLAYMASPEGRKNPGEVYQEQIASVIRLRKQARAKILDYANQLRKAIIDLREMRSLKKMDVIKRMGKLEHYVPKGYRDAMAKAFDKEALEDVFYYKPIAANDPARDLGALYGNDSLKKHRLALKRKASILLLEELGFKDEWRRKIIVHEDDEDKEVLVQRPFKEDEVLTDDLWTNYVESIITVPKLSSTEVKVLQAAFDKIKEKLGGDDAKAIFHGKGENGSWSEAKEGSILFSSGGDTFKLGKSIEEIEGAPKENLTTADDTANNAAVATFLTGIQTSLKTMS